MPNILLNRVPSKIREKLGSRSTVCLLNGKEVFSGFALEPTIIMACNPRIRHVIPGIMRAAQELDAVIAFELTRTEGGIDGGYTGQTPQIFFDTVINYADETGFTKPFIIHADHITVKDNSANELEAAQQLVAAQLAAGFTSFAIDASFNPLPDNISLVSQLAKPILAGDLGLEVEIGEALDSEGKVTRTTPEEAERFLAGLADHGVSPQLLAIENGYKRGNILEGEVVLLDLEGTRSIYEIARSFGLAGLVQHGITGTPLRLVGKLADYGIKKGNIGTLWQNVAHAGLPLDLMDAMRQWARSEKKDIKYATGVFKADIDTIPEDNRRQIEEMAFREAKEFITAFNAKGSATRLAATLNPPA